MICCSYVRIEKLIMNISNFLLERENIIEINISWLRAQALLYYWIQYSYWLLGCEVYQLKLLLTKQLGKGKSNRLISVFIKQVNYFDF